MDFLKKIKKLYSISDEDNNGYNEETIIELEDKLKIRLPKALRDYYLQLGKNWHINEIDMILYRLDGSLDIHERDTCPYISSSAPEWKMIFGLETENEEVNSTIKKICSSFANHHIKYAWDSGYLIFCTDVEGAFSWGIKLSDLNKDNPIVSAICNYPGYTHGWDNWKEIFELDKFLLEMAYSNGAFGGLRYYAISDINESPLDHNAKKIIKNNWKEIKEISKNTLRKSVKYFTNDNTEILWYSSDQLYMGTSDPEKMQNMLNMFDLKWSSCRIK